MYRMYFWEIETSIRVLVGPPRKSRREAAVAAREALNRMIEIASDAAAVEAD
jgi:hypothetical protein